MRNNCTNLLLLFLLSPVVLFFLYSFVLLLFNISLSCHQKLIGALWKQILWNTSRSCHTQVNRGYVEMAPRSLALVRVRINKR